MLEVHVLIVKGPTKLDSSWEIRVVVLFVIFREQFVKLCYTHTKDSLYCALCTTFRRFGCVRVV